MAAQNTKRKEAARAYIHQRLAENPKIAANTLARELDERRLNYRRTTMLHDIRKQSEALNISRATQAEPAKFTRKGKGMSFPTLDGAIRLEVVDKKSRSKIGSYYDALDDFLSRGDDRKLKTFRGKFITVGGVKRRFITDPDMLLRIAEAGELIFEGGISDI